MKGKFNSIHIREAKVSGEGTFEISAMPPKPIHIKDVPGNVVRKFKATCAAKGRTMHDVFIELMVAFCKQ